MFKKILFKSISIIIIVSHLSVVSLNGLSYKDITPKLDNNIMRFLKKIAFLIDDLIAKECYADFEPPESAAFQSGAIKNFQADLFTGAARYKIPIVLPQGRDGIQPNLSLNYSSQSANGWCGVGWNLEIPSISRSTKWGVPNYDNSDIFIYNSGDAQIELVNIGGNEYRVKIEGEFLKFTFDSSSWQMIDKSGKRYFFGSTDASRQTNPSGTFEWCLDKVIDSQGPNFNGNYMTISYFKDQDQIYPEQIQYTGNEDMGNVPYSTIDFIREPRTDIPPSYITGYSVVTAYRLKEIDIKVDGNRVRKYVLNYVYSAKTNRSLLDSCTQYDSDEAMHLNPITFSYQQSDYSISSGANWISGFGYTNGPSFSIDCNNDGLADALTYDRNTDHYRVALSDGNSFITNPSFDFYCPDPASYSDQIWPIAGDYNGDGLIDIGTLFADTWWTPQWVFYFYMLRVNLSNGSGFSDPEIWYELAQSPVPTCEKPPLSGEFNGDILSDVVFPGVIYGYFDLYLHVMKNNGNQQFILENSLTHNMYRPYAVAISGDFNGDSLTDIALQNNVSGEWFVALCNQSQATGFEDFENWLNGFGVGKSPFSVDINNDGLSDIICFDNSSGQWTTAISNGTHFIPSDEWIDDFGASKFPLAADFDGDGLIEPTYYDANTGDWYVAEVEGTPYDLLIGIDNGIGGTTDIEYEPSPHNTSLPFVVQTVSSVTTEDGMGNSYTTNYEYQDGLWDAEDREFRGFGYVKTIDAQDNYTETIFLQDDIFKGKIQEQRSFDSQDNLYGKTVNTWQSTNLYPGVDFAYLAQIDNYTYDGDSTGRRTQTQYIYDSYGNSTQTIEWGEVDLDTGNDIGSDKRTTFTEYTYNTSDWLLKFPKHTYVQNQDGVTVKETWFYYDENPSYNDSPIRGNLTKLENWLDIGANPTTTFTYDDYGNILTTTDANYHITSTTYDSTYHMFPVKSTNPLGHEVKTIYYGVNDNQTTGEYIDIYPNLGNGLWGQKKSIIDPNSTPSFPIYGTFIYDTFGRTEKRISPLDSMDLPAESYYYDLSNVPVSITIYRREVSGQSGTLDSISFYDGLGRLIETKTESEVAGQYIISDQVEFNTRGLPYKKYLPYFDTSAFNDYVAINPSNPHTTIEYDPIKRPYQQTNPDGSVSNIYYSDWTTTTIDANGRKQVSYLDAYNRLVQKEEYTGVDGRSPHYPYQDYQLYATTQYDYDCLDNLIQTIDNQGNIITIQYDTLLRKISMTDPDMGYWIYSYDAVGNLISQTDAKNQTINFEYDELNRITLKDYPEGQQDVIYIYDNQGIPNSLGRLTNVSYGAFDGIEFSYDILGQETQTIKEVNGIEYHVQRSFDTLERISTLEYPDSETLTYTYNSGGQIESVASGSDTYVVDVDYNAAGQITYIEYGNGTNTTYTYDENTLRLTNILTEDSQQNALQNLSYTYDDVGNVLTITDNVNTANQTFTYDELNRLASANGQPYGLKTYEYDTIGNMLQKSNLTFTYGENGAGPHAVTFSSDGTTFMYDANGNMASRITSGGVEISYNYDFENRLIELNRVAAPVQLDIPLQHEWNFVSIPLNLPNNSIPEVFSSISNDYEQVSKFDASIATFQNYIGDLNYDQFNTISPNEGYEVYISNASGCTLSLEGEVISQQDIQLQEGYNLITNPNLQVKPVEDALSPLAFGIDYDEILRYDAQTQSFESYPGTLTELVPGEAYFLHCLQDATWHFQNPNSNSTTQFVYDGEGGRTMKITNGYTDIYIGSLYEYTYGEHTKHIFLGSMRIASKTGSDIYYYHSDHLGSSNVITDSTGEEVQLLEYAPYGEVVINQGSYDTSYKFTSKELDETGLYYYGARYYDPSLGRFITPDTYIQDYSNPQTFNRYTYCGNNPVNYIDPSGNFWGFILGLLGIIATVATVVSIAATIVGMITQQQIFFRIAQISGYVGMAAGLTSFVGNSIKAAIAQKGTQLASVAVDLGRIVITKAEVQAYQNALAAQAATQAANAAAGAAAASAASAAASSVLLSGIGWSPSDTVAGEYIDWAADLGASFTPAYQNTNFFSGVGHSILADFGISTEANALNTLSGYHENLYGYSGGARTISSALMMGKVTARNTYLFGPPLLAADPHYIVRSGASIHVYKYQSPADPLSMINVEISTSPERGIFIGLTVRLGGSRGVSYITKPGVRHRKWIGTIPE